MNRPTAFIAALAIGLLVVSAHGAILALAGRPAQPLQLMIIQVIMVAMPFLFMVLARITARGPWMIALTLTLALWGYSLVDALVLAPGRGPNVALGLLMLASPVILSIICAVLGFARKDRTG